MARLPLFQNIVIPEGILARMRFDISKLTQSQRTKLITQFFIDYPTIFLIPLSTAENITGLIDILEPNFFMGAIT